jgi:hypothetical protein
MECDYDLFEVLADGAPKWRGMAAGRENAVRKLAELSKRTINEVRVIHLLTNTLIASVNGLRASVRAVISIGEAPC